jgi:glyoxylase-like metal-dependent hydrolase (beta-lactamase superfamily II)
VNRILLIAAAVLGVAVALPSARQPKGGPPNVLAAAAATLGAADIQTIRYGGFGSIYSVGQSPAPSDPWPRVTLKRYTASVDYAAEAMQVDLVREGTAVQPRGGGQPVTGEQRQIQGVSGGTVAWNVAFAAPPPAPGGAPPPAAAPAPPAAAPTPPAVAPAQPPPPPGPGRGAAPVAQPPQPAHGAATERGQQLWLTPHGFIKAAIANKATIEPVGQGTEVSFTIGAQKYTGVINGKNQLEKTQTWIDNPALGDMLVETVYTSYETFGAIAFPTRITQRQGGHPSLDLFIASVEPNADVSIDVPDGVRGALPPPVVVEARPIADGVSYLTGGSHHSVAIEMTDHVVLVEAPLNEARSIALLDTIAKTYPGKPVRTVINTHHHFDHAGGLRTFVDAGAAVVTHAINAPFYERAWTAPRTLGPDRLAASKKTPAFVTFTDRHALTDGRRTIEIHRVAGSPHHDGFAMVYLPAEKLLIEADAYTPAEPAAARGPRRGGGGGPPAPAPPINPVVLNLYQNVQRLKLDVGSVVALHGSRIASMADLAGAAGR